MPPNSTFRVDLVDALYDLLIAYQAANPTLLRKVYRTRPAAFQELPSAFVGPREESITHTSGTRERSHRAVRGGGGHVQRQHRNGRPHGHPD